MNHNTLQLVLSNYANSIDRLTSEEGYKWEVIKAFQARWDLAATDLRLMLREAIKGTGNLLDSEYRQPGGGLLRIAKTAPEAVRRMLADLLADDGGDLAVRQARIEQFVSGTNQLLEASGGKGWREPQDRRAAITLLCLCRPDDNFIFKYTEAAYFAKQLEYGDARFSQPGFSLASYYAMCEEVVAALHSSPALLAAHRRRLSDTMYEDRQLHVLASDIIYCTYHHSLSGSPARRGATGKVTPKPTATPQPEDQPADLTPLEATLRQAREAEDSFTHPELTGLEVHHRGKFGAGRVIMRAGDEVTVRFADGDRRFQLPSAFTAGYLATSDASIRARYLELDELVRARKRQEAQLEHAVLRNRPKRR